MLDWITQTLSDGQTYRAVAGLTSIVLTAYAVYGWWRYDRLVKRLGGDADQILTDIEDAKRKVVLKPTIASYTKPPDPFERFEKKFEQFAQQQKDDARKGAIFGFLQNVFFFGLGLFVQYFFG